MRARAVTTEQVLAAADAVARSDGLDRLTVRRLCAELGVTAPSVYVHFASKDDIVEQLVDSILAHVHHPGADRGDWVDRLREFIVSVYDQVAPYPGLAARIARQLPTTPSSQRNAAFVAELMRDAALAPDDRAKVMSTVLVYTWGHLLGGQSEWAIGAAERLSLEAQRERYLWGLDHLLDAFRRDGLAARSATS
ncbi:MAG TPA: TetR/AcrR family transcriptional regulator [Candidatus Dormibacteraeota bacterium]|nr:TetR/AcrR family transcriptional regulator [Candidatus Dormibacteraeota bacterium]